MTEGVGAAEKSADQRPGQRGHTHRGTEQAESPWAPGSGDDDLDDRQNLRGDQAAARALDQPAAMRNVTSGAHAAATQPAIKTMVPGMNSRPSCAVPGRW
ncbi:hypothetical protein [Streptomyces sp. AM6-12]|uniref:hypothetical protein n=1 Tax=Streptomyces sp. AM6-12 TaxID=3345149 RepID=UPI0037A916EB